MEINKKEYTPSEKLNAVLTFLNKDYEYQYLINGVQQGLTEKFNQGTVHKILDQLVIDGYAIMNSIKIDPPILQVDGLHKSSEWTYTITFKGQLFIEKGGYLKQEQDNFLHLASLKTIEEIRKRNERMVAYGSVAAAIIAGFLMLLELWKVFHPEICSYH